MEKISNSITNTSAVFENKANIDNLQIQEENIQASEDQSTDISKTPQSSRNILLIILGIIAGLILLCTIGEISVNNYINSKESENQVANIPSEDSIIAANNLMYDKNGQSSLGDKSAIKINEVGYVPLLTFDENTNYSEVTLEYTYGPQLNTICGNAAMKQRATDNIEIAKKTRQYYYDGTNYYFLDNEDYSNNVTISQTLVKQTQPTINTDGFVTIYTNGDYAMSLKSSGYTDYLITKDFEDRINHTQPLNAQDFELTFGTSDFSTTQSYNNETYHVIKHHFIADCLTNGSTTTFTTVTFLDKDNKIFRNELYFGEDIKLDQLAYAYNIDVTSKKISTEESTSIFSINSNIKVKSLEEEISTTNEIKQDSTSYNNYLSKYKPYVLVPTNSEYRLNSLNLYMGAVNPKDVFMSDIAFYPKTERGSLEYKLANVYDRPMASNLSQVMFLKFLENSDFNSILINTFEKNEQYNQIFSALGVANNEENYPSQDITININGEAKSAKLFNIDQIAYSNNVPITTKIYIVVFQTDKQTFTIEFDKEKTRVNDFSELRFALLDTNNSTDLNIISRMATNRSDYHDASE